MEELLTIREVARYLGLSERTVYDKARRGEMPAIKVGRVWRVRRRDLEEWLGVPRTQEDRGSYQAFPEVTRTGLTRALAVLEDPLERRLTFVALLSSEVARLGWTSPVIIGGHAVEFYTAGGYTTADIDLAAASEPLAAVLSKWGFDREGRHWYDRELGLAVEAPSGRLAPEQEARATEVRLHGSVARVLGIEDLVIDRLNACVHWESQEDCDWALTLLQAYRDRLDMDYLCRRARSEEVLVQLETMLASPVEETR